jgi:hypothetical protein
MASHIRGGPCRLVNFAFGKENSIAADRFQSRKPEILKSNNWDVSRYHVYLNNRAAGKGSLKTIDLCDQ